MRKQIFVWTLVVSTAVSPTLLPTPALAGAGLFATEYTQL
jgi:hypothetical protein